MKINQNISAVIVNDQLLRNENSVAASVKRLSSGLKFNDAKDNPSGIAISFKMQAQINALNRASLNATDGTSMVETIDGAMGEMTEVLQRIRELCVQAANDTNMEEDREAIQQEIDALKKEVNRISSDTEFNGKTLLDGSLDRRTYVTSEVTLPDGSKKPVSMYDKITNVIISDEVQADNYNVRIEEPAKHAVLTSTGQGTPGSVITEKMEGTVTINGVKAEIKAGMSAEEVYQTIRDAGDAGWVNVFVAKGNPPVPATGAAFDDTMLDTQGYEEDTGGYEFNKTLAFVSQNYGSSEDVTITCDNVELAEMLGISNIPNVELAEIEKYSIKKDSNALTDTSITTTPSPNPGAVKDGVIYINGVAAEIKNTMTAEDAYKALEEAAAKSGTKLSHEDGTDAADYDFSKKLIFTMPPNTSHNILSITFEDPDLGELFGLNTDAEAILTTEYKAVAEGEDAQVSITKQAGTDDIRDEYTGQAVVKTTGNQVEITDKSGFEMSFEVRGDVAYAGTDDVDITIEATDIGTLQLQIGANEDQELAVRVPVLNTKSLYMDDLNVVKKGGPDKGMDTMDKAIGIVTAARSLMGAYENRLDYVKSGLDETEEDMTTAISRLADVDMAAEMTEYTNSNVLTQASISVLSQANDLPQQVLSLLQG